ncbi:MAG: hypothetical protein JW729_05425, partial [Bacteroidales bacterium]|nr:hypothetical protein [Bacteroidales bacterium]
KRTFWLEKLQLVLAHDLKIQIHAIDKELQQHKNQITKETLKRIDKENTIQRDYQIVIPISSKEFIQNHLEQIDHLQQIIQMADPINILKKGFTITRFQGKLLKSTDQLKANSIITTEFADGEIESSVQNIYKNEQETNL